jgi:hypothetical protein
MGPKEESGPSLGVGGRIERIGDGGLKSVISAEVNEDTLPDYESGQVG